MATSATNDRPPEGGGIEPIALGIASLVFVIVHAARPSLSYRALELGATSAEIGLIGGAYGVMAIAMAIPIGRWADHKGPVALTASGITMLGLASLVSLQASQVVHLMVANSMFGLGHILVAVAVQATLAATSIERQRDNRFARLSVLASTGGVIGPLLAGYLIEGSVPLTGTSTTQRVFFVTFGIALAAFAPIVLLRIRERSHGVRRAGRVGRDSGPGAREVFSSPGVVVSLLASMVILTSVDLFIVYMPLLGESRGLTPSQVGLILAVRSGAALVSRALFPLLRTRWSGQQMLLGSLALAAVAMLPYVVARSLFVLIGSAVFVGMALGLGTPLTTSQVAGSVPSAWRGRALAVRLMGNRLGQVALPPLAGLLGTFAGVGAIFVVAAVVLSASVVAVSRRGLAGSAPA